MTRKLYTDWQMMNNGLTPESRGARLNYNQLEELPPPEQIHGLDGRGEILTFYNTISFSPIIIY